MVELGCDEWDTQPWPDAVDHCDGQANHACSRNLHGQNHYQPQFRRSAHRAGYAYSGVKRGCHTLLRVSLAINFFMPRAESVPCSGCFSLICICASNASLSAHQANANLSFSKRACPRPPEYVDSFRSETLLIYNRGRPTYDKLLAGTNTRSLF